MKKSLFLSPIKFAFFIPFFLLFIASDLSAKDMRTIVDARGRQVSLPLNIEHILCSGSGCLRLITYLESQHKIVAVDDLEKRKQQFDARPYALANPQFKQYPIFGEFRGHDNPELIMGLSPRPQVIFKTFSNSGYNPTELQEKTGIPVVVLEFGNLASDRDLLFQALNIAGSILGKKNRAQELIQFFDSQIAELNRRTHSLTDAVKKNAYVGGIAYGGPHGFQSTEPGYPPFQFINTPNVAAHKSFKRQFGQASVSKEKLLLWNPDILFLDLSTLQLGDKNGGLYELKTDPVYQALSAVQQGEVFGVLPYNWYSVNHGSVIADAWFIGKILYPERFKDIEPEKKADEIYTFLVGKPVFEKINANFRQMIFKKIPLEN